MKNLIKFNKILINLIKLCVILINLLYKYLFIKIKAINSILILILLLIKINSK